MSGRLAGRRVVVTRSRAQAAPLIKAVEAEGGESVAVPLLQIVPPDDGGAALRNQLGQLGADDWLVVLSPNGARAVLDAATAIDSWDGLLAVVGATTLSVFEAAGRSVELVADPASAAGLLTQLPNLVGDGRVLVAQAEGGRPELVDGLRNLGIDVVRVPAYRNVEPAAAASAIAALDAIDVVMFTSPSAVRRWVRNGGPTTVPAASIGPTTTAEAESFGFVVVTSEAPDVASLVNTVLQLVGSPLSESS